MKTHPDTVFDSGRDPAADCATDCAPRSDHAAATLANPRPELPVGWPAWLREAAALAGVLTWSLAWLYASSLLALVLPTGAP
jgi:hypothetical protein